MILFHKRWGHSNRVKNGVRIMRVVHKNPENKAGINSMKYVTKQKVCKIHFQTLRRAHAKVQVLLGGTNGAIRLTKGQQK